MSGHARNCRCRLVAHLCYFLHQTYKCHFVDTTSNMSSYAQLMEQLLQLQTGSERHSHWRGVALFQSMTTKVRCLGPTLKPATEPLIAAVSSGSAMLNAYRTHELSRRCVADACNLQNGTATCV